MSFPERSLLSGLVVIVAVACASPQEAAMEDPTVAPGELVPLVELDSGAGERLQAIDPGDGRVLWASGIGGTVVRSADGGATWAPLRIEGASELELRDIEAIDAETAFALAAGPGEQSRILATTDGGTTWIELWRNPEADAFYDCLDVWPSGRALAFSDSVDGALLVASSDDGSEWTVSPIEPQALPGEGGFAASGTCLIAGDEGEAWIGTGAGGAARVFSTRDGGDSWRVFDTPIFAEGEAAGILSLARDEGGGLFAFGGDIDDAASRGARIARSDDDGRTWALVGEPGFSGAIYGGAARGEGEGAELLAVGPGGAAHSPDAGASWRPIDKRSWWAAAWSPSGDALLAGPEGRLARWSPR